MAVKTASDNITAKLILLELLEQTDESEKVMS